ncbi:MAG: HAMP domain-containing sensor histidine kinase [Solirubrobacterales bacterium]
MSSPSGQRSVRRRPFGVRLYLALAFAAVALITAGLAYLLTAGESSERDTDQGLTRLAIGQTVRLANEIGDRPRGETAATLAGSIDESYAAWAVDAEDELLTPTGSAGVRFDRVRRGRSAVRSAQAGIPEAIERADGVVITSAPIFRDGTLRGAVLARSERPPEVEEAIEAAEAVRGERITALAVALAVAILVSFLIASAITTRVKRLAESAARISEGGLDEPLEGTGGRDEITDLGRALETMRGALRGTFSALREERDRLSAILEALSDAVMVVQPDGEVRFSNAAARELITPDGRVIEPLIPWLRRSERRSAVEQDALPIGDRVYSLNARQLPAEGAVLAVVRDRTEELRREVAEREFVSNAAHELRNPIAGITGAIEVLRAGAKDEPEARDHFLSRLDADAERISRLTDSLLTLARMEAVGEGGTELLDVALVVEEASESVIAPEGIELRIDVADDPVAQGDRVLLRQVIVGLLTNAFKNTPPPGTVTVTVRPENSHRVLIEIADTGTGIAAEEVDRIFERFYRGSDSLDQEGFGLGLSIARRMVDVMGGEMGVTSQRGKGSRFWIRLRAAKPAVTPVA